VACLLLLLLLLLLPALLLGCVLRLRQEQGRGLRRSDGRECCQAVRASPGA
jgi:hypothetical protein